MKRLLLLLIMISPLVLSAQNKNVVSKTDGSITFLVDKDLPAPKNEFRLKSALDVATCLVGDIDFNTEYSVLSTSFDGDSLYSASKDVLYQCVINAYVDHRPLVLSPDVIWLTICQGFARYVNAHSEKLRPLMVNHKGKETLIVETEPLPSGVIDWCGVIDEFSQLIKDQTKSEIATVVTSNFTTTGSIERVASEITLMNCVEKYFEYQLFIAACGIPTITLTGTPDDWRLVLEKTRNLAQFGLEKWVASLEPILNEFIRASEGEPKRIFWRSIAKTYTTEQLRGASCAPDSDPPDVLDGWILKFYPDEKGKTKRQLSYIKNMPPNQVCVPFKCIVHDGKGVVLEELDMAFIAGVVGFDMDSNTGALTPRIGWIVSKTEPRNW